MRAALCRTPVVETGHDFDTRRSPSSSTLIEERSAALREAVAAAPDLDRPRARLPRLVATRPGRPPRRRAALLGRVVDARPTRRPALAGAASATASRSGDLLEWSAESTAAAAGGALRDAGPDAPCWAWWAGSDAPLTAGAVARHQVQEAAVHAYDAQEAIGKPEPLPAAVAVDGVGEFLAVGLGSLGRLAAPPGPGAAFKAIEGPSLDARPLPVRRHGRPGGQRRAGHPRPRPRPATWCWRSTAASRWPTSASTATGRSPSS